MTCRYRAFVLAGEGGANRLAARLVRTASRGAGKVADLRVTRSNSQIKPEGLSHFDKKHAISP